MVLDVLRSRVVGGIATDTSDTFTLVDANVVYQKRGWELEFIKHYLSKALRNTKVYYLAGELGLVLTLTRAMGSSETIRGPISVTSSLPIADALRDWYKADLDDSLFNFVGLDLVAP